MDAYFKKRDRKCRMALLAATAMLAVAMAGFLVADTDDADADETYKMSVEGGIITNGSCSKSTASTSREHTVTITANNNYFVPPESATTGKPIIESVEPEGSVIGAKITSYKPSADRKTATVVVSVDEIIEDGAKVKIRCTCDAGTKITFTTVTPDSATLTVKDQYGAYGLAKTVTLTVGDGIFNGYVLEETAKIGTATVPITVGATSATLTVPATQMTAGGTVNVELTYELDVFEVTLTGSNLEFTVSKELTFHAKNVRVDIFPKKLKDASGEEYSVYHAPATASIAGSGTTSNDYKTSGEGNATVGYFVIADVTGDVEIRCNGVPNEYTITFTATPDGEGKVNVHFKDNNGNPFEETYTYNESRTLPDKAIYTIDGHPEYIFERCYEINEETKEKQTQIIIPAGTYGDQEVLVEVTDNMDYAETLYRNIEIVLCLVAAAIMAIAMVVRVR